jgi:hypothetical protein
MSKKTDSLLENEKNDTLCFFFFEQLRCALIRDTELWCIFPITRISEQKLVEGSPGYVYAAQGWGNMIGASIAGQKCLSYYLC